MVKRDLVKSRALAQRLVLDGQVQVDGTSVFKPGTKHILYSLNTELILAFQGETAEKSIDNPCYTNKREI
jgi:predicted rRNA methylase YqxC with S4 and FtsJ domains